MKKQPLLILGCERREVNEPLSGIKRLAVMACLALLAFAYCLILSYSPLQSAEHDLSAVDRSMPSLDEREHDE